MDHGVNNMGMGERSSGQRTYYSPDDIVIYPPPELELGFEGKIAEACRTPVAELSGEDVSAIEIGSEMWRTKRENAAELDGSGDRVR